MCVCACCVWYRHAISNCKGLEYATLCCSYWDSMLNFRVEVYKCKIEFRATLLHHSRRSVTQCFSRNFIQVFSDHDQWHLEHFRILGPETIIQDPVRSRWMDATIDKHLHQAGTGPGRLPKSTETAENRDFITFLWDMYEYASYIWAYGMKYTKFAFAWIKVYQNHPMLSKTLVTKWWCRLQ